MRIKHRKPKPWRLPTAPFSLLEQRQRAAQRRLLFPLALIPVFFAIGWTVSWFTYPQTLRYTHNTWQAANTFALCRSFRGHPLYHRFNCQIVQRDYREFSRYRSIRAADFYKQRRSPVPCKLCKPIILGKEYVQ